MQTGKVGTCPKLLKFYLKKIKTRLLPAIKIIIESYFRSANFTVNGHPDGFTSCSPTLPGLGRQPYRQCINKDPTCSLTARFETIYT